MGKEQNPPPGRPEYPFRVRRQHRHVARCPIRITADDKRSIVLHPSDKLPRTPARVSSKSCSPEYLLLFTVPRVLGVGEFRMYDLKVNILGIA